MTLLLKSAKTHKPQAASMMDIAANKQIFSFTELGFAEEIQFLSERLPYGLLPEADWETDKHLSLCLATHLVSDSYCHSKVCFPPQPISKPSLGFQSPAWGWQNQRDELTLLHNSWSEGRLCSIFSCFLLWAQGFPGGSAGKESACNTGDPVSIPGLGRSPGEGNANPL